ncbi:deubiquitinase OTUD6B [Phlebotomus argentipes]|uniref:deubiquitinase OTUD6B n=1 Tax=Phlebotomus argentipes TaxID=94469 RepID=UPI002892A2A5|nr:deubiquitinase OTUD6B [Phlebotomus argentipes]
MSDTEENDIHARHRKERKEMQAKIQELKKASKSDKKKKKESLEEIARLESELDERHAAELNGINREHKERKESESTDPEESHDKKSRLSKAQRRREKKEKEERDREAMILAAEALNINTARQQECTAIRQLLQARKLAMHEIPSDGNCLYNAVNHQLTVTGRKALDVTRLRGLTADYIFANKDSLLLYMTNQETNNPLTDAEFSKYCDSVKNTAAWGGQIEIKALSHSLHVPIEVIQAAGPPTVQGDTEFEGPNLVLTYHRHMYSLGEHFNSTKVAPDTPEDN